MNIKVKSQVRLETIKKAAIRLRTVGLYESSNQNYNGTITIKTSVDGKVKTRAIEEKDIRDAYKKSLQEYGEKL